MITGYAEIIDFAADGIKADCGGRELRDTAEKGSGVRDREHNVRRLKCEKVVEPGRAERIRTRGKKHITLYNGQDIQMYMLRIFAYNIICLREGHDAHIITGYAFLAKRRQK
jgi:hypothetical protein